MTFDEVETYLKTGQGPALLLLHGMAVAAFAARYRSTKPLPGPGLRTAIRYLPLAGLVLFVPFIVLALLGGIVFWAVDRRPALVERLRSHAVLVAGRVVLAVVAVAGLLSFVPAVTDIAGRGP
jgi:hypothetical protein